MKNAGIRGTDISRFKRQYRERNEGEFPDELIIRLQKDWDLKYGENPNQHAAVYTVSEIAGKDAATIAQLTKLQSVRSDGKGKGGLSLTNLMDITRAVDVLKYFEGKTAVIMKHAIVSGFATQTKDEQTLAALYRLARDSDRRSNFGGTVAFNAPLDMATAEALHKLYQLGVQGHFFVDVIAAPSYEDGVVGLLERDSPNVRIAGFSALDILPKFYGDSTLGLLSFKEMPTGRIGVQDVYLTSIRSVDDLITDPMVIDREGTRHVIGRDPTPAEARDLLTAWYINIAGARSNGIVFVKDGVLVAMGSGQVERVGAVEQAIMKGYATAAERAGVPWNRLRGVAGGVLSEQPFEGAVCSSDGFFPNPDSVETLALVGVKAAVQPYGSIMDAAVIDAANQHGMTMPAAGERCFGHF